MGGADGRNEKQEEKGFRAGSTKAPHSREHNTLRSCSTRPSPRTERLAPLVAVVAVVVSVVVIEAVIVLLVVLAVVGVWSVVWRVVVSTVGRVAWRVIMSTGRRVLGFVVAFAAVLRIACRRRREHELAGLVRRVAAGDERGRRLTDGRRITRERGREARQARGGTAAVVALVVKPQVEHDCPPLLPLAERSCDE